MEKTETNERINWLVAIKIAWKILGVIIEVLAGKEEKEAR